MGWYANEALALRARSVLRIVTAFLRVQRGTSKFFGYPHVAFFDDLKLASLLGLAGALELVGGTLLLVGLFTRAAAFILGGEMAFAYFIAHASDRKSTRLNSSHQKS